MDWPFLEKEGMAELPRIRLQRQKDWTPWEERKKSDYARLKKEGCTFYAKNQKH